VIEEINAMFSSNDKKIINIGILSVATNDQPLQNQKAFFVFINIKHDLFSFYFFCRVGFELKALCLLIRKTTT
jgi:hypothetical protein